ncbi:MAG: alpha/beta fold hydrolase [Acidimicrobiales bacterium]
MTQLPPIRYAKTGEIDIAYRVLGSGPLDLVFVPGLISNLEIEWEDHVKAPLYRRLATFARLITFDKRGMGLSDRSVGAPTLEERMDDVRAVMDAVGSERAALIGASEGGLMSMLFAATYPERTAALVLFGTLAGVRPAEGFPHGNEAVITELYRILDDGWGTGASAKVFAQSLQDHPGFRELLGRIERASGSPRTIRKIIDGLASSDVRAALPTISAPTLVVHTTDDLAVFNLDFAGFDITELTVNGDDAPYARHDGELTIEPTQPITNDDRFTIQIAYTGTPVPGYSAAVTSLAAGEHAQLPAALASLSYRPGHGPAQRYAWPIRPPDGQLAGFRSLRSMQLQRPRQESNLRHTV